MANQLMRSLNSHSAVLVLILRLRQLCGHPNLVLVGLTHRHDCELSDMIVVGWR